MPERDGPDRDVPHRDVPDRDAPAGDVPGDDVGEAKRAARRRMREVRQTVAESGPIADRSAEISRRLIEVVQHRGPIAHVLSYRAVGSEVDPGAFHRWCEEEGIAVEIVDARPDAEVPVPADWADLIVVPGLAFTTGGDRLGQGGGWYDRLLARRRADCLAVGLAFLPQVVASLPIAEHDQQLDCIVTEDGATWAT